MKNVDAWHCGESIDNVQILYSGTGQWNSCAQYYHETSESNDNYSGGMEVVVVDMEVVMVVMMVDMYILYVIFFK